MHSSTSFSISDSWHAKYRFSSQGIGCQIPFKIPLLICIRKSLLNVCPHACMLSLKKTCYRIPKEFGKKHQKAKKQNSLTHKQRHICIFQTLFWGINQIHKKKCCSCRKQWNFRSCLDYYIYFCLFWGLQRVIQSQISRKSLKQQKIWFLTRNYTLHCWFWTRLQQWRMKRTVSHRICWGKL